MSSIMRAALPATLLFVSSLPAPAHAAESYDNCTGFIDDLPAVITTQGTWCLRKNVATAMTAGNAITIDANNVTIDCNDFKVGGLAAGPVSVANGIYASGRLNATVRQCGVRGFSTALRLTGGGHLVEDNRLDGNLALGIWMEGEDNLVRRNRVFDTGSPEGNLAWGIYGDADIVDNIVAGVEAGNSAVGAMSTAQGAVISGNNVVRILAANTWGISAQAGESVIVGNHVGNHGVEGTVGVSVGMTGMCSRNLVSGYATAYQGCTKSSDNLSLP